MSVRHIVLFNGPPQSGKTSAARMLSEYLSVWKDKRVMNEAFAHPLKQFLCTLLGEKYEDFRKDDVHPVLFGFTPRQLLISLSEDWGKPKFGRDIFGRGLYHRVLRALPPPDFVVLDDCGFAEEAEALLDLRMTTIEMHRKGATFEGDSRSYWIISPDYVIENDGTMKDLQEKMKEIADELC